MAHLTKTKLSEQRFFRSSDCDCDECRSQELKDARWIAAALALIVAAFLGTYAIVRLLA